MPVYIPAYQKHHIVNYFFLCFHSHTLALHNNPEEHVVSLLIPLDLSVAFNFINFDKQNITASWGKLPKGKRDHMAAIFYSSQALLQAPLDPKT